MKIQMHLLELCLLILISMGSIVANAKGGYVGNGGDAINCTKSASNRFEGYYALDYVATLTSLDTDDGLNQPKSWAESRDQILKMLQAKSPTLATSFEHFTSLMFNVSYSQDRTWEPTPFGLSPLDDQRLTSLIPVNCMNAQNPQVIQAVIRLFGSFSGVSMGHIIYKYDAQLLKDLEKKAPLQLSFLMVHEWLWDLSTNIDRNRRVNRFLHSHFAESLSANDFEKELNGMGLQIPTKPLNSFDPLSCQGYPLTEKQIHEIYPGDRILRNWGPLKIARRERAMACESNRPDCDRDWQAPHFLTPPALRIPFSLSPSWLFESSKTPINIVGASAGHPAYGGGDIKCSFVAGVDHNLECTVDDVRLRQPLFGDPFSTAASSPIPKESPVVEALLTEECFRMKITGHYMNETYMGDGRVETVPNEFETVFSARVPHGVIQ